MLHCGKKLAAFILAFCAMGCGPLHSFPHVLHIDSKFTPVEQQGIIDAIDEWEKATGGLVKIKPVITEGMNSPNTIGNYSSNSTHNFFCVHDDMKSLFPKETEIGIATIAAHKNVANDLWLDEDALHRDDKVDDEAFGGYRGVVRHTAMHELGHHFGLKHPSEWDERSPELMQPSTDEQPDCITPADLYHFCQLGYDCMDYNVKTTCTVDQLKGQLQDFPEYE